MKDRRVEVTRSSNRNAPEYLSDVASVIAAMCDHMKQDLRPRHATAVSFRRDEVKHVAEIVRIHIRCVVKVPRVGGSDIVLELIERWRVLYAPLYDLYAVQVRFGTNVQVMQQEAGMVTARFSDGTAAAYDVVVGGDGIRSTVRRFVGGETQPRYRGQTGWRFVVSCPAQIGGWTVFLAGVRAFLIVPIGGGGRVYCYADQASSCAIDDVRTGRLERLQRLFDDFAEPVRAALANVESSDAIHCAPIEDVAHAQTALASVVLIGDASHAMSPNMACGVAMALEDALVLADTLHDIGDATQIATAFARRRSARVEWVRAQTDQRDRMRGLPSLIRDLSLRLFASRIYRNNYQPLLLLA